MRQETRIEKKITFTYFFFPHINSKRANFWIYELREACMCFHYKYIKTGQVRTVDTFFGRIKCDIAMVAGTLDKSF